MQAVFRVPEGVVSEVLDGEAVLLHLETGKYFGLNASGTRMWALLSRHGETQATFDALQAEFPDVSPDQLRADLDEFVAALLARGLVEQEAR